MKAIFTVFALVCALAVGAYGGELCELVNGVMPEGGVTQEVFFNVINQLFGCLGSGATSQQIFNVLQSKGFLPEGFTFDPGAMVSKGFVSQFLFLAFGLRGGLAAMISQAFLGLTAELALDIAQLNGMMVQGGASDPLTGREFAACVLAWIDALLHRAPLPCGPGIYANTAALRAQLSAFAGCINMSFREAAQYFGGPIRPDLPPTS